MREGTDGACEWDDRSCADKNDQARDRHHENTDPFPDDPGTCRRGKLRAGKTTFERVMIDRKTHEKAAEHAFEAFKQEVAYEENKAVDELVSYTYHKAEE